MVQYIWNSFLLIIQNKCIAIDFCCCGQPLWASGDSLRTAHQPCGQQKPKGIGSFSWPIQRTNVLNSREAVVSRQIVRFGVRAAMNFQYLAFRQRCHHAVDVSDSVADFLIYFNFKRLIFVLDPKNVGAMFLPRQRFCSSTSKSPVTSPRFSVVDTTACDRVIQRHFETIVTSYLRYKNKRYSRILYYHSLTAGQGSCMTVTLEPTYIPSRTHREIYEH